LLYIRVPLDIARVNICTQRHDLRSARHSVRLNARHERICVFVRHRTRHLGQLRVGIHCVGQVNLEPRDLRSLRRDMRVKRFGGHF